MKQLLILPGDGIGHEITQGTQRLLEYIIARDNLAIGIQHASVGGTAYEETGVPLPPETLSKARAADAILLGAVGGPQWETLDISARPEIALLGLRKELGLFANFRPAILYPQLANASTLKPEVVADLDILIIRELTGGIYFGQPRGIEVNAEGERYGYNTYVYTESEIRRIAYVAFDSARKRQSRVCSVDKANVLEVTELWREVVTDVATEYPDVELSHMYVDNAVMQLIRQPKQFDVILTGNMFGDILSDAAAMLTGSIGMLPSASLNANKQGMYEPVHGSAPDIAGQDVANPLATILSLAMLFRYSFDLPEQALAIEKAVSKVLSDGYRTADIYQAPHETKLGTEAMAQAVIDAL